MLLLTAMHFLSPQLYFVEMTPLLGPLLGNLGQILPLPITTDPHASNYSSSDWAPAQYMCRDVLLGFFSPIINIWNLITIYLNQFY